MLKVLFLYLLLITASHLSAQQGKATTLKEIIYLAQLQSPSYKLAQTQREVSQYEYVMYLSDLKPQMSVYGEIPGYSKQYTSVTQPNGSIQFLPVQQNFNRIGFSLSQVLPLTGGQLSLNTDLNQFYDFQSKFNQYNGTPVFLSLNQPVFAFNEWKWKKKIEPLKAEESRRKYVQELENIAQDVTKLYFDALDAQSNIRIAQLNLMSDSSNYEIELQRVNLGTTTEDRQLQLQLQLLKSRQDLSKALYEYKMAELALLTFIGYNDSSGFLPLLPENIPMLNVPLEKAIEYVKNYRPEYVAFERKKLEAQRDVAQAKAQKQQVNINATYGLNRAAETLPAVYKDLKSQQTFSIGINVPIVDWGRRKARYNTSVALQKLQDYTAALDNVSMQNEVTILVNNIELLKSNIGLAKITDSIAQRRFNIANSLYQIGKLTIIEMNLAQSQKDLARRAYITALRDYWTSYYVLRRITMYDFEQQKALYK